MLGGAWRVKGDGGTLPSTVNAMRLFVYGTLLDDAVCEVVFDHVPRREPARLWGYRLHQGEQYLFVRPQWDALVHGAVLSLEEADLVRADRWEEVPTYERRRVRVELESQRRTQAWVYVQLRNVGRCVASRSVGTVDRNRLLTELTQFRRAYGDVR